MVNGENDSSVKIYRRFRILSDLDHLIKESAYYRALSHEMREDNKIIIGNISSTQIESKVL